MVSAASAGTFNDIPRTAMAPIHRIALDVITIPSRRALHRRERQQVIARARNHLQANRRSLDFRFEIRA